ncbi:MAG: TetR family transcriptional regulator [Patulibacter sp.]|nr:TetR family transcriptional regulator [Patulibacter sp.]
MSTPQAPPRATNASGRQTRLLLIWTAERLFAERGIDAVSLREVSAAAGMRMAGAVAYHFGGKDGLIEAIVAERMGRIDELRRPMLAAIAREGRVLDVRAATEVALRPGVRLIGESGYFFRFLAQLDRLPQALERLQDSDAFRSTGEMTALQDEAAARIVPAPLVAHRRRLATQLVLGALADTEARGGDVDEVLVSDLVDCVVGLYTAPSSQSTSGRFRTPGALR